MITRTPVGQATDLLPVSLTVVCGGTVLVKPGDQTVAGYVVDGIQHRVGIHETSMGRLKVDLTELDLSPYPDPERNRVRLSLHGRRATNGGFGDWEKVATIEPNGVGHGRRVDFISVDIGRRFTPHVQYDEVESQRYSLADVGSSRRVRIPAWETWDR